MEGKIVEVSSGVHVVEGIHTNFVLIEDGDEVTYVDSGWPKDRSRVERAIAHLGRSFEDVRSLVLTHAHADHLGNAAWMQSRHGVNVSCHGSDGRLARGEIKQGITLKDLWRAWRPVVFRFAVDAMARGGLRPEHLTEFEAFTDGDVLDVAGSPRVVHTPGHTDGHSSFHLPNHGVLLSGDALVTHDFWDPAHEGPCLLPGPFNGDAAQALRSLDRLEDLRADIVVPGHGPVFRGSPREAVALARERGV